MLPSLVDAADSVELKICLIDGQVGPAVAALGIDLRKARPQQVFYLDTPDLTLHQAGLIVRARQFHDRKDDSVIKLRPVTPDRLGADLRHLTGFKVEIDVTPGGFVCSASLKRRPHEGAIAQAVVGTRRWSRVFTTEQRRFFDEYAPDGLTLDDLGVLGPVLALRDRQRIPGLPHPLVVDLWSYPGGRRLLEISRRVPSAKAFAAMAEWRTFITKHHLPTDGNDVAKTATTLQLFAHELTELSPR